MKFRLIFSYVPPCRPSSASSDPGARPGSVKLSFGSNIGDKSCSRGLPSMTASAGHINVIVAITEIQEINDIGSFK